MAEMSVKEFAKYVLNNLNRATLANALNIADKLDNPDYYNFIDFVSAINEYARSEALMKFLGNVRVCKIVALSYDYQQTYNSDKKYNKRMIIDNYIIELWNAINKTK